MVTRWTFSVQLTCTSRAGHSARSVRSWAFIEARSVSSSEVPASLCGQPALPLIQPPRRIVILRDQGMTWDEIAEQVGMTASGVWSRYRKALPPKPLRLGRWQQVLADALDQNLAIGVRSAVADHLGRTPNRAELTAARRAAHSLAASGRARVRHVPGADADASAATVPTSYSLSPM
jgi:Sigma-70, region 4